MCLRVLYIFETAFETAFESGAGIDSQLSITRCGHRASQAEEVLTDARAELERLQGKRQKA